MDAQPSLIAFSPLDGGATGFAASVTISATTSSSSATQLPGNTTNAVSSTPGEPLFYKQIQVSNTSAGWAYINCGPLATVAAATVAASYPVAPGTVIVMTINGLSTGVTVILGTGSGNVVFTRGQGL
jgi:hypothetical protein